MTVASQTIKGALRALGVLEPGATPTADEYADAVQAWNEVLGGLSAEQITVPSRTREVLTFSASQPSYTIGAGGDLDTDWPLSIDHAFIRYQGFDYPVTVADSRRYKDLFDKYLTGTVPGFLYYEPSYPLGRIYFSAQPSADYTLILTTWKPLTLITDETTVIDMMPGWDRMFKWLLAYEMATEFDVEQSTMLLVAKNASDAKSVIEGFNFNNRVESPVIDSGALGLSQSGFDIESGNWI